MHLLEFTGKIWKKIDPHCQWQQCSSEYHIKMIVVWICLLIMIYDYWHMRTLLWDLWCVINVMFSKVKLIHCGLYATSLIPSAELLLKLMHSWGMRKAHCYGFASSIMTVSELSDNVARDPFKKTSMSQALYYCIVRVLYYIVLPDQKIYSQALRPRGHQFQRPSCDCTFSSILLVTIVFLSLCCFWQLFWHLLLFYLPKEKD